MAPPPADPRGSLLACWLGGFFMRLAGWRVTGSLPGSGKLVVIAAPHTSNWDFVLLLGAAAVLRVRIHWLGKASLFRPPFGAVMRWLGGIPVDRSRSNSLVEQLARRFAAASHLAVVIPPTGTRSRTAHWKSGFYWTAEATGATVVCSFLDYPTRTAGVGHAFVPSGDVREDMRGVRAFYRHIRGKYPEQACEPRLKEEDQEPAGAPPETPST